MSDIKLSTDEVIVEGTLNVNGPDIKLAIDDRKNSANSVPYRRALVHGVDDTLVVNYNNDYVGVEINGSKSEGIKLNGTIKGSVKIEGPDIFLEKEDRKNSSNSAPIRRAVVHGHQDQLVLNYGNDYLGVVINGNKSEGIKLNGNVQVNNKNIEEMIKGLQENINYLLGAINRLEEKAGLPLTPITPINIDLRNDPVVVNPRPPRL